MQRWEYTQITVVHLSREGSAEVERQLVRRIHDDRTEVLHDTDRGAPRQETTSFLNQLGARGWELVSVTERVDVDLRLDTRRYAFKRPVPAAEG